MHKQSIFPGHGSLANLPYQRGSINGPTTKDNSLRRVVIIGSWTPVISLGISLTKVFLLRKIRIIYTTAENRASVGCFYNVSWLMKQPVMPLSV
jgi:hypothetical protein